MHFVISRAGELLHAAIQAKKVVQETTSCICPLSDSVVVSRDKLDAGQAASKKTMLMSCCEHTDGGALAVGCSCGHFSFAHETRCHARDKRIEVKAATVFFGTYSSFLMSEEREESP